MFRKSGAFLCVFPELTKPTKTLLFVRGLAALIQHLHARISSEPTPLHGPNQIHASLAKCPQRQIHPSSEPLGLIVCLEAPMLPSVAAPGRRLSHVLDRLWTRTRGTDFSTLPLALINAWTHVAIAARFTSSQFPVLSSNSFSSKFI